MCFLKHFACDVFRKIKKVAIGPRNGVWRVVAQGEIIQGKSVDTCSGRNFMRGSCPRGNYSGKNIQGAKVQGTFALGEFHMWGNCVWVIICSGRNYSEVIVLGQNPRRKLSGEDSYLGENY